MIRREEKRGERKKRKGEEKEADREEAARERTKGNTIKAADGSWEDVGE